MNPSNAPSADTASPISSAAWWRHAVIYQIYPRSWADGNGDGIGDLPGITARLPYLRDLGVDAVWLSPFYVSPMADAGYDVANYHDIDPLFGTLSDADALISQAHELGLRVIVDLVPNHSSDEHEWFQAALAAAPGSPERARYIFRDGKGADGSQPPNNWQSVFGGSAWTRITEADGSLGQWYLHLFDVKQPDFDWTNPEVSQMFLDVLAFWLDRGVDGFRVDVAHGLVKVDGLPDWDERTSMLGGSEDAGPGMHQGPMWDQDGVHEIYREWRELLESYNPDRDPQRDRILCAEAWVAPAERAARYVRGDEMHQAFNFEFLQAPWSGPELRDIIDNSLTAATNVGAPTTWVLSNHDVIRHASRLGLNPDVPRPNGIGIDDAQPNAVIGLRRARAATALMLALPGSAYLYQGEELGLPEHTALPDAVRQDPTFERSEGEERGRDGCRIPMAWEAGATTYGFGESADTWLPQPELYGALAVDRQEGVPGSTLELYRTLLEQRRQLGLAVGTLHWIEGMPEHVVACEVETQTAGRVAVLTNTGADPVDLPAGEVLLSTATGDAGLLPGNSTVWLRR